MSRIKVTLNDDLIIFTFILFHIERLEIFRLPKVVILNSKMQRRYTGKCYNQYYFYRESYN